MRIFIKYGLLLVLLNNVLITTPQKNFLSQIGSSAQNSLINIVQLSDTYLLPELLKSILGLTSIYPTIDKNLFNMRQYHINGLIDVDPQVQSFVRETLGNKLPEPIAIKSAEGYSFLNNYILIVNQNNPDGKTLSLLFCLNHKEELLKISDEKYINFINTLSSEEYQVRKEAGMLTRVEALKKLEQYLNVHRATLYHEITHYEKNDPLHDMVMSLGLTGGLAYGSYKLTGLIPSSLKSKVLLFLGINAIAQHILRPLIFGAYSRAIEKRADEGIPNQKEILQAICHFCKEEMLYKQEQQKEMTSVQRFCKFITSWFNTHSSYEQRYIRFKQRLNALEK